MNKALKFTGDEKIEIPFDFQTYVFYKDQSVLVEDSLHEFIKERFPLSFSYGDQLIKQADGKEVEHFKTKSYFPSEKAAEKLGNNFMGIESVKKSSTFTTPDGLPPSGQEGWYGEGVQNDTV